MSLRKYIPKPLVLQIRLCLRSIQDLSRTNKFSTTKNTTTDFPFAISIQQEIKKNEHFENKIENIQLGIDRINNVLIAPGEVFSFWKLTPKPTSKNGFKLSRNIIDGVLKEDYGGGLCQLSSIIYHCALISGMNILERHNHSVDLYREEERFTPLGSDATIVYGYKDLRIRNPFNFPVKLTFQLNQHKLTCIFSSPSELIRQNIQFESASKEGKVEVLTYNIIGQESVLLNKASYLKAN